MRRDDTAREHELSEPEVGGVGGDDPQRGRLAVTEPQRDLIAHAAVAHFRGDAEQTIAFAHRAPAELDEGDWMLESVTRWYLALAEWLRGQPAEAERAFASSFASIAR